MNPTAAPYRWPYREHRTMAEVIADEKETRSLAQEIRNAEFRARQEEFEARIFAHKMRLQAKERNHKAWEAIG